MMNLVPKFSISSVSSPIKNKEFFNEQNRWRSYLCHCHHLLYRYCSVLYRSHPRRLCRRYLQHERRRGRGTLSQGFHLTKPTQQVTTYSIGIEQSYLTSDNRGDSKENESFEVPSNDGKGLTVDMTFTYRFDPDKVSETFTRFKGQSGKEVKETFIKPNIMSWTKEITAKYSVIDLLGDKRASLNAELTDYLKEKFEPYGIIIESVSLINIDPDEETRAAVQKKGQCPAGSGAG